MLVKDLMVKHVVTISQMATLRDAMNAMRQHKVKSLVVEKRHAHDAYGIITYTNILQTIVAEEGDIDLINVYDVYTKPVISVGSEMDVKYLARLMVREDRRRVVVLDNNDLSGIITMNDIVDAIVAMADK